MDIIYALSFIGPGIWIGGIHVRILEILLLIFLILNVNKIISISKTRKFSLIFVLLAFFLYVSNVYGYFFLDVPPNPKDFMELMKYAMYISVFYLGYKKSFNRKEERRWIITSFIIVITLTVFALLQIQKSDLVKYILTNYYLSGDWYESHVQSKLIPQPGTTFGNVNSFCITINMIYSISISLWAIGKKGKKYLYLSLLVGALILLTMSRTGIFMMFLVTLITWLFSNLRRKWLIAGGASFVLTYLIFFLKDNIIVAVLINRIKAGFVPEATTFGYSGLYIRIELWKIGIKKYMMSPFLGWGMNKTFRYTDLSDVVPSNLDTQFLTDYIPLEYMTKPHNEFIDMLIVMGIFGLVMYLVLFYFLLKPAFRIQRMKDVRCYQIALLSIVLSLFFSSLSVGFIFSNLVFVPILYLVGLLHKTIYIEIRNQAATLPERR